MTLVPRPLVMVVAATVAAASLALTGAVHRPPSVVLVDFGVTPHPTAPVYDARVAPAAAAPIKEFRIPITHTTVEIAPASAIRAGPSAVPCPVPCCAGGRATGCGSRW